MHHVHSQAALFGQLISTPQRARDASETAHAVATRSARHSNLPALPWMPLPPRSWAALQRSAQHHLSESEHRIQNRLCCGLARRASLHFAGLAFDVINAMRLAAVHSHVASLLAWRRIHPE